MWVSDLSGCESEKRPEGREDGPRRLAVSPSATPFSLVAVVARVDRSELRADPQDDAQGRSGASAEEEEAEEVTSDLDAQPIAHDRCGDCSVPPHVD